MVGTPRRVVFSLDSTDVGGTELSALRTAMALPRDRYAAELVVLRAGGPLESAWLGAGMRVTAFPLPSLAHPRAARQLVRLRSFLREPPTTVLHSHDMYTNLFAGVAARLADVPVVVASRRWSRHLIAPRYRRLNRVAYGLATCVVANSRALLEELVDEGVPRRRLRLVENFVEPAAFEEPSPEARRHWRAAHGIPLAPPLIGVVARLRPEKGHAVLLHALARIRDETDAHLVFAGDGPEEGTLRDLAGQLGLTERTHLLGLVPNRPNPQAWFDVSVCPSLSEGAPNAVLEAMAAARPIVASAVGGIVEAITDGGTGCLVPPRDPAALAGALMRVFRAGEEARAMGRCARAAARARFSVEATMDALDAIYGAADTEGHG
jgi:glycosyltransferase involved in cell wall biosynthesis